jgi:hypothetical protein
VGEPVGMFKHIYRTAAISLAASTIVLSLTVSATRVSAQSTFVRCTNNVATDTTSLQSAIYAATGSTVTIAAGTCALTNHLRITHPVTITGAGAQATFLVQHAPINIMEISSPWVTVENLNLDTAAYNPGLTANGPGIKAKPGVLYSAQSHTSVINVTAEAGSGFGMRITGSSPCQAFPTVGTVVQNLNITNTGVYGFASLDIDCTNGASLSNITVHGDYIAMFKDENVTLNGESYTGGARVCQNPVYITGSSANITLSGIHGGGRVMQRSGTLTNISVLSDIHSAGC